MMMVMMILLKCCAGVHYWTIGQRTHLGGLRRAYFVAERDILTQTLAVVIIIIIIVFTVIKENKYLSLIQSYSFVPVLFQVSFRIHVIHLFSSVHRLCSFFVFL